MDEERDQLLGVLIGAVVIGAVGHQCRQAVGIVEGTDEVVAGGLARRIRAVRIVLCLLGEEAAVQLQRSVDLIGRDVVEALALVALGACRPDLLGRLQQAQRAEDIGAGEGEGIADAAIHVTLGREEATHGLVVADVGLDEGEVRCLCHVSYGLEVARVGELVEADDVIVGVALGHQAHDVPPDEARPPGDEEATGILSHECSLGLGAGSSGASCASGGCGAREARP